MVVYLKYISEPIVQVGGTVATPEMISDGWFPYYGDVPVGDPLALIDGKLVPFEERVGGMLNDHIIATAALKYLNDTDHKMLSDYEPYPNEDLEAVKVNRSESRATVRAYQAKYKYLDGDAPENF
jgi:hypothetical protein